MPTITFYAKEETVNKLEKILARRTKKLGYPVSRGNLFAPYIDQLYELEIVAEPKTVPLKIAMLPTKAKAKQ